MQPEISIATLNDGQTADEQWSYWLYWAKILFVAGLAFFVFLIAEHDPKMATLENFVQDIEDQESWAAGGNTLRRLAFLSCAGFGLAGLMMGQWHKFRWNLHMILLALYFVWIASTLAWSIDSGATMRRFLVIICCAIGCVGISRFLTIEQVIIATMLTLLGWLCVGIGNDLLVGAFRPHKGDYRFAGTLHPNLQAANLAVLCIAAFSMSRLRPKFKLLFYAIFMIGFMFLVLTKCRSGTALLPVSLVAVWFFTQPVKYIATGTLISIWCVASMVLLSLVTGFDPIEQYSEILLLGRGEETGSSLTGRLPLWKDLSTYIADRPWHGYGFGAFWTPRNIYDIATGQDWTISEAHSSYVDTALQSGLVGVALMVAVALSTLIFVVKRYRQTGETEFVFVIGVIVFCLLRGFTESGLSNPSGYSNALFLAMASHSWNATTGRVEIESVPDRPPLSSSIATGGI